MQEIEVKILNIDIADIEQKLIALGAKKIPRVFVIDKSFDYPDHRLSKKGNSLRLRQLGDTCFLTYKNAAQRGRVANIIQETETSLGDFATAEKILQKIGMRCYKHREKKRTSFVLGTVHIDIDEYPQIPPYLEIEGSQQTIADTVQKLGYTLEQTSRRSATEVLKKYKVKGDVLLFDPPQSN